MKVLSFRLGIAAVIITGNGWATADRPGPTPKVWIADLPHLAVLVVADSGTGMQVLGIREDLHRERMQLRLDPSMVTSWVDMVRASLRSPDSAAMVPLAGTGGEVIAFARVDSLRVVLAYQGALVTQGRASGFKVEMSPTDATTLLDLLHEVSLGSTITMPVPMTADSLGPVYWPGDDTTVVRSPHPKEFAKPEYPYSLQMGGVEGTVWVRYRIAADGQVEKGSIEALWASDSRFAKAAVEAIDRSRFKPATRQGAPVRSGVYQVISFLQGSNARPPDCPAKPSVKPGERPRLAVLPCQPRER